MGFLKRFFRTPKKAKNIKNSFENLTKEEIEAHLEVKEYGDFVLTGAICPSYDLRILPIAGFKCDIWCDSDCEEAPTILISLSREILFDVFVDLLDLVGSVVDVILETSHNRENSDNSDNRHQDIFSEDIDLCVLKSVLFDFENLLLSDGCTGISVCNKEISLELKFDEHKLICIYNWVKRGSEILALLKRYGVLEMPDMKFMWEAQHMHLSSDELKCQFEQLKRRLGADNDEDIYIF